MIVKMRFLNISGPRDDIDRVCEKYLSKYEMQIENAVTELKTTENIMPFVEVNPYRDPLAKAEQFAQLGTGPVGARDDGRARVVGYSERFN